MDIVYNTNLALKLDFTKTLDARGLVKADLTDVVFMVKVSSVVADEDAVIDIRLNTGLVWETNTNSILVRIPPEQWARVAPAKQYIMGVGFKVAGDLTFTENHLEDKIFNVCQDFIRS